MEKFGLPASRTTVTSAAGSSSRARRAALIPASLPPIMTTCMAVSLSDAWSVRPGRVGWLVCGRRYAVMRSPDRPAVVRDDDAGGLGGGDGRVQRLDDRDGERPADDLRAYEAEHRARGDPGEGVGEHPADGDGLVGEAGRGG